MSGVNLNDFPQGLATQLGVSLFAGQILASCIMVALFVFPTLFLSKKFGTPTISALIMGVLSMSLSVALGWLPVWVFVILCLIIALVFSRQITGIFR